MEGYDRVFLLRKWYFDVVTPDGTVFIGYAARLRWGLLRARYRSYLLCRPRRSVEEAFTLRRSPDPEPHRDGSIGWTCPPLGVSGRWKPTVEPVRRRLFECPSGVADWDCVAPAAEVTLRLDGKTLEGLGYAERLVLTTPPWEFGGGDLLWGRFVGASTSVIWVQWKGTETPPLVIVDGKERAGAVATMDEVRLQEGGGRLELGARRTLREGPVVEVLAALPRLIRRLPGGLDRVAERKWLSPGEWTDERGGVLSGWAIHEVVEWRSPGGR
jgi:hypothetical protein